ncbi:MAG TPA: DNA repair protein RecO, partial [Myxococcota bacterium]|nr:DNA repair protein RecO [Myxococcota bacterium]
MREAVALVLSGVDSRDDRILRLLTEDDQLLPVIARNARRASKKGSLSSRLQTLSLVRVEVARDPSHELVTLSSAEVLRPFATLKGELLRLALASAMAEVVLHVVPEHAREDGLHELLVRALSHLDDPKTTPREDHFLLFLLRILDQQGILPPLDELPELSTRARETLEQWREGRFAKLSTEDRAHTS